MLIALAVTLVATAAAPCYGASRDARHFTVDILAINGEEFVVKDESGTQGTIHVSADTEKYGQFKPGDRIEAWVFPNGHAKTILVTRSASVIQEDQLQSQAPQESPQQAQR